MSPARTQASATAVPEPRTDEGAPAVVADPVLGGAISALASRLGDMSSGGGVVDAVLTDRLVPAGGAESRLHGLAASFGLEPDDLEILVVPLAAALDTRFGQIYAGLLGTAEGCWPTIGIALRACGLDPSAPMARARLAPGSPLIRSGLLSVADVDRPFPQRSLSIADRVVAHLLGDDSVDPAVAPVVAPLVRATVAGADALATAIAGGLWLCWVRELPRASGFAFAAEALGQLNAPGFAVDLRHLPAGAGLADVLTAAVREATLRGAGLVIGPIDLARDRIAVAGLDDPPCPVVLVGPEHWNPQLSSAVPFVVEATEPTAVNRLRVWQEVLSRLGHDIALELDLATYRLTPEQIVVAAASAVVQAGGEAPDTLALAAAARSHNAGRLERLVRRVTPIASFDQLVLGDAQMRDIREVINRYRTLELVRGTWGVGGAHSSRGVTCLFYGPSGTGKTLSAEVIAHELGVDLFVIDLSQVVDKYIGETEKNLERIFSEAENVNGLLFFDEADALFGKRSEVKDAHDRHANVEVAYLLQRMERFEGVAVLATNLQAHIDEAFSRRLDVVCDFRNPDEDERRRLWQLHLPPTLPQADDIDIDL
ncbi:MAG: hypothetical protein QOF18_2673, partial [Frankiaceae bacterium]|nr:hypothetical protein [Frankiaceae bacterium]